MHHKIVKAVFLTTPVFLSVFIVLCADSLHAQFATVPFDVSPLSEEEDHWTAYAEFGQTSLDLGDFNYGGARFAYSNYDLWVVTFGAGWISDDRNEDGLSLGANVAKDLEPFHEAIGTRIQLGVGFSDIGEDIGSGRWDFVFGGGIKGPGTVDKLGSLFIWISARLHSRVLDSQFMYGGGLGFGVDWTSRAQWGIHSGLDLLWLGENFFNQNDGDAALNIGIHYKK